jgi:hypothetical protein
VQLELQETGSDLGLENKTGEICVLCYLLSIEYQQLFPMPV